jgi:DNA polymerase-3 subunit beta
MTLFSENPENGASGTETIACEYAGDDFEVAFNTTFLHEALNHFDKEQIEFRFDNSTRAVVLEPVESSETQDILMLLMPVRLT